MEKAFHAKSRTSIKGLFNTVSTLEKLILVYCVAALGAFTAKVFGDGKITVLGATVNANYFGVITILASIMHLYLARLVGKIIDRFREGRFKFEVQHLIDYQVLDGTGLQAYQL